MEGGPDVASIRRDLQAAGIDPASYPDPEPVEYLADNQPALDTFLAMRTQWVMGPGGAVGLRYEALPLVWERLRITGRRERDRTFSDLQVMEAEALDWMGERRAQRHD